jgi:hypothetical protein
VFHDTLVDNVRDLVALLPGLNIMNDQRLADIATRMQGLCRDDADTLRDNPTARASVAAEADAILREVSDYMA